MKITFLILSFLLTTNVLAKRGIMPDKGRKYDFNRVLYKNNYDGDTVRVDIPQLHPLIGDNMPIRIKDINTPELRGKKPCEKKLAREAAEFVRELLTNAKKINLTEAQRGTFFRMVAVMWVDGVSLGDLLLEKKLAVVYGTRPKDWCNL